MFLILNQKIKNCRGDYTMVHHYPIFTRQFCVRKHTDTNPIHRLRGSKLHVPAFITVINEYSCMTFVMRPLCM